MTGAPQRLITASAAREFEDLTKRRGLTDEALVEITDSAFATVTSAVQQGGKSISPNLVLHRVGDQLLYIVKERYHSVGDLRFALWYDSSSNFVVLLSVWRKSMPVDRRSLTRVEARLHEVAERGYVVAPRDAKRSG